MSNEKIIKLIRAGEMDKVIEEFNDRLNDRLEAVRKKRKYIETLSDYLQKCVKEHNIGDFEKDLFQLLTRGEIIYEIDIKDMEKKEHKRDKNGRFTKKEETITNEIGLLCPKKYAKYANLWYLRELDYHPESLAVYIQRWKPGKGFFSAVDEGAFHIFETRDEADKASKVVRAALSDAEYETLVLERDAFKILAEKYMSKYLNKCYDPRNEQENHLSCLETLGEAYRQIGWYTSKMSWLKRWLLRKEMKEMDMTLYRMFVREERLIRE